MGKHPRRVEGYDGSLEELACAIGNMDYEQVSWLLEKLSEDFERQAENDRKNGRLKLAKILYEVANDIKEASGSVASASELCRPYMKS